MTINGVTYSGNSVSIQNGKVTIDGKISADVFDHEINIIINGDIDLLDNSNGTVTANNVGSISTQSGNVICKDVSGSVSTMSGDIACPVISGNARTMSGDINALIIFNS